MVSTKVTCISMQQGLGACFPRKFLQCFNQQATSNNYLNGLGSYRYAQKTLVTSELDVSRRLGYTYFIAGACYSGTEWLCSSLQVNDHKEYIGVHHWCNLGGEGGKRARVMEVNWNHSLWDRAIIISFKCELNCKNSSTIFLVVSVGSLYPRNATYIGFLKVH